MVEQLSPLAPVWQPGRHGNVVNGVGVMLSETATRFDRAGCGLAGPGEGA